MESAHNPSLLLSEGTRHVCLASFMVVAPVGPAPPPGSPLDSERWLKCRDSNPRLLSASSGCSAAV